MKRIVHVDYEGNCPICGERQYGCKPEEVDTDCYFCAAKKRLKEVHDTQYKALEEGILRGITGYDNEGMPSMMQIITNDFIYDLEFEKVEIVNVWKR